LGKEQTVKKVRENEKILENNTFEIQNTKKTKKQFGFFQA
jgi:hypothetical protein